MKYETIKYFLFFTCLIPQILSAQNTSVWNQSSGNTKLESKWAGIQIHRSELNKSVLDPFLRQASRKGESQISFLDPHGKEMVFTVQSSNLMSKGLQGKYPEIKTFKGVSSKGERVRFTITSAGMTGIVFTQEGTVVIEPESFESTSYVSYYKNEYLNANHYSDFIVEELENSSLENSPSSRVLSNDVFKKVAIGKQMKKYRIAIAAESGYTSLYGGKVKTIEAIVTTLDFITAIFEKELAVTFELIADNDQLVYSAGSDPYKDIPKVTQQLRVFNQEHLDEVIGFDNYDLGFLFTSTGKGLGAQASAGHVCRQFKAAAMADFSSFTKNLGVSYASLYVGHEIGHLFEALHSWSGRCSGTSSVAEASSFTIRDAYELGSGSTIMSYAGFCGDADIVPLSETGDYFHAISSTQILRYINEEIASCATQVETGNTPPTVQIPEGGFVIPINTPFALEANGEDTDDNTLTYCWEQFDQTLKQEYLKDHDFGPLLTREELEENPNATPEFIDAILALQDEQLASAFEGDGPLFRSFPPSLESLRYFPQIEEVLAGDLSSNVEVLPFKTRDLNFVVTVRDNLGGVTNELISFSSTDVAGPFEVTSAFTEPSYAGFSNVKLEWDVANTNNAPVNCQNVSILYSIDGGENFDVTLVQSTANDGSEIIRLPNLATSKARIMVKAVDNVFFNVNDTNFSVEPSEVAVPEASTALVGTRLSTAKVELTWEDNSDFEDGFIIERSHGDDSFEEIAKTTIDVNRYVDETINAGNSYAYRVAAYNIEGTSAYSNTIQLDANILSIPNTDQLAMLYPNPAHDELNLSPSLIYQAEQIRVVDLNGKTMLHYQVVSPIEKIDVSSLKQGMYLVVISTQDGESFRKFYKK
ncbi:Por secretion system C-terminal sorting domain-containing protein [Reichenbachiella agariperforans]|uniref:Por secretion system C-terminal sorting domain-containing protein n=2 Tax=Reichenbachiella agariperforans TaxID=156994 RepID=A0A1M6KJ92_REIAG|nr:Por secretion system C-terminal sorting domain-containing protein [Reichenbachiella agariperforans]